MTLYERFTRYTSDRATEATRAYVDLAANHGLSPVQMSLAYVTSRGFVTSNIIGATTLDQLRENLGSASVSLEDDVLAAIEDLNREYTYPCP